MMNIMETFVFIFLISATLVFGSKTYEKVKLENIQALTLKVNKMTTGRRSSPVPQLACMSNCHGNLPHTVQCINSGWDGSSIQWECKADLQEGFKFGDLAVICEGYDYPDDPYILAGSCGLEYTLISDKSSGHGFKNDYGWQQDILGAKSKKSGFGIQDMVALGAIAVIIYALYKTCIARPMNRNTQESPTDGDVPPDDRQFPNMGWNIPGMGANRGYGQENYPGGGASCGASGMGRQRGAGAGAGGFWTGLATGGLMGYMFGNRGGGYQQQQYYAPRAPSSGFFGGSQPSFGSSSYSSSSSRPSTGFAETRRR